MEILKYFKVKYFIVHLDIYSQRLPELYSQASSACALYTFG